MLADRSGRGVLIVGHGPRERRGVDDFLSTVRQIGSHVSLPVEPCFLELASPTISDGVATLAARGVRQVLAVPLLLLAAGHVRRDIPGELAEVAGRHAETEFRQLSHLDCHERILQLSAWRYREALAAGPHVSPEATLLLLVGRGSGERSATEEMYQFAELRRRETPVGSMKVCFLAMEKPSLEEALAEVGAARYQRVVVQPHLLFSGYLSHRVDHEIEAAREHWPASDWVVTEPLGPHPLLAEAVAEIVSRDYPASSSRYNSA